MILQLEDILVCLSQAEGQLPCYTGKGCGEMSGDILEVVLCANRTNMKPLSFLKPCNLYLFLRGCLLMLLWILLRLYRRAMVDSAIMVVVGSWSHYDYGGGGGQIDEICSFYQSHFHQPILARIFQTARGSNCNFLLLIIHKHLQAI